MIEIKKIISNLLFKTKENPPHYLLDHKSAEIIWKCLFQSGHEEQARMLSQTMIKQGCQEVEVGDGSLILMFWKDYMEENNIMTFRPDDKELH